MDRLYHYHVSGYAAQGQTWNMKGTVTCRFDQVFNVVNLEMFQRLTHGKAVFGKPGLGCKGPYTVKQFDITLMENEDEPQAA